MARISGIDIPSNKRLDVALTYIYGVGRTNVKKVLEQANIPGDRRVSTLTDEEVNKIGKIIEKSIKVEGDLRREISENIKRMREIGSYRGLRHSKNLPSRGQRTKSNGRTRRGKRLTIGAMKKDDRVKVEASKAPVKK